MLLEVYNRACTLTFYPFCSLEESCCFWRSKFQGYHKQISFRKRQWKLIRTELSEDTSFSAHVEFPGRSAFLLPMYYAAGSVNSESCVWWSTTQVISWENAFCSHTLMAIYKFLSSAEYRDIYKTTGNWDRQPWIWYPHRKLRWTAMNIVPSDSLPMITFLEDNDPWEVVLGT